MTGLRHAQTTRRGVVGHLIGLSLAKADPPPFKILMIAFTNAYAIYFSICGLGILISSLSERRGRAIGAVMTLVVSSFMINFIAEYWEPAAIVKPFSLLTYYRPLITLQSETFPLGDITILSSIGLVSALTGAWVFNRRDIHTT